MLIIELFIELTNILNLRFEYAVGHWLQKTAEHVMGCVLCSPGCFSLIRMSSLASPNVMAMYKSLAQTPLQKLQYDQVKFLIGKNTFYG